MPTTYLAPGVYIEEVRTGARVIEAVGTSTGGFVGVTPKDVRRNELIAFRNWTEFATTFVEEGSASTDLSHAVYGFFLNGGRYCYVCNVGAGNPIIPAGKERQGLRVLEQADDVAIVAAPGFTDAGSYDALLSHAETLKDRVAILDPPADVPNVAALTRVATAAAPARRGRGGPPPAEAPPEGEPEGARSRLSPGGYGAQYFPRITVRDPLRPAELVDVPPSGHVAGVYARSDGTRGVHKAPANEPIRGALNVTYRVTREEQELLNPAGVNVIRFFPIEGVRIYGARTLDESSSEWKYINVRRLFNMAEESIARSTRWVVFEPNDRSLWKAIRRDVSAFLLLLWRDGALVGRAPEEAFFVKCDEETNPPESIDAGRVVILIGMAPVKPAEFVIFRIGQEAAGAQIES